MRPNVLIQRLPSLVALVALASATGCADERSGPATGSLDGKCYPNGTCNPGLACESAAESNICVAAEQVGTIGGACYDNGTCNPGLACNGTTCADDPRLPVGTIGGPCFGNGACYDGLVCKDLLCAVNTVPHPGLLGGVCYDNGTCNPGLNCENGACVEGIANGELGGGCLVNGTCRDGLLCVGTVCEVDSRRDVGTVGAPCFPNGTCDGGLECVVTTSADESSAECAVKPEPKTGELDEACYPNGTCNGGLVCDLGTCVDNDSTITVAPGMDGGLCFANGTCDDGLVCNFLGKCEPIVVGGLYGACDAAGGCNLGLSCQVSDLNGGTTCLPTVEHLGSIHGVVTDYITNARLANVQVTLIHMGQVEQTTSDALGYYSFDNLSPGHFEITFAKADGKHTIRRLGDVTVACNLFYGSAGGSGYGRYYGDVGYQDQECNQVHDIDLFPFTGTQHGRLWYLNDQEVTPAAGVMVVADFSDLCGCTGDLCNAPPMAQGCEADGDCTAMQDPDYTNCPGVDISPDRFTAVTDADGRYEFTALPNTGAIGVRITVMPSVFNGFDYESWGPVFKTLDVFVQDNVEVFLTPQFDPPFIVANNWEDFLYGGFDVSEPIEMTFSRSMKTAGCDIHLAYAKAFENGDRIRMDYRVPGVLVWSNDNMTATFTPAQALNTSASYAVHVHNCESALDDQGYNWISGSVDEDGNSTGVDGGGDLCCNVEGNACYSSEWNRQDFVTQDGIICSLVRPEALCFGPDDSFVIACNMAPNLADSAFELYRVVTYPGHSESNPDRDLNGEVLVPVTFTSSVVGNTVIVNPTDSLVPTGEYRFNWTVASSIENDTASGTDFSPDFCEESETLEFIDANLPVVTMNNGSYSCIGNGWVCHTGMQSEGPELCGGSVRPAANCEYGALETTDGAQNIVMNFSKDVNIALSKVTIENDDAQQNNEGNQGDDGLPVDYDQFGLILDATVTAAGAVITVNPAANLPVGTYTVRYVVAAADGLGVAVGHLTFDVVAAPACIAFTGDNLGDRANANYNNSIKLDFSTAVDPTDDRNIIKLVDELGVVTWPSFSVANTKEALSDNACEADPACVVDGRVIVANPDGKLSPDRDYTVTFKIYAAASRDHTWQGADESEEMYPNGNGGFCGGTEHGIYTQAAPITFTTEGHITLVSTTVGTYTDSNKDGYYEFPGSNPSGLENCDISSTKIDCGDFQGSTTFAPNGVISLTFTEAPDLGVYHARNFARLYRYTGGPGGDDNATSNYDLVATTTAVAGNTITLSLLPLQTLQQPGGVYCIGYQVTSAIAIDSNGDAVNDSDVSENVGGTSFNMGGNADDPAPGAGIVPQLCFSTATPVTAPPTAPTAAPTLLLVNLVDSSDMTVQLRNSVLQGATAGTVGGGTRWYEFYASAEDGSIDDYLLWQVREDCQQTAGDDCVAANTVLGPAANNAPRAGLTVLGQDLSATVCNGANAPAYCSAGNLPFADGESVFFRVRACTGSVGSDVAPLCGPYSAALEVSDSIPPDLLVYVLTADIIDGVSRSEGVNDFCDGAENDALTFNVFGFSGIDISTDMPSSRERLGGPATISVRQGGSSAPLANVTCAALAGNTAIAGNTVPATDIHPLLPPAAYTAYAPTWYTPADGWPNWTTDANGWNTLGVTMFDHIAAEWMYFPPLSVVTFKCTVPTGINPLLGTGGVNSTINISASDTSGNSKDASQPVPAGDQCVP